MNIQIRRFKEEDAEQIVNIVRRNFLEVNIRDYPLSDMEKLAQDYNYEKICNIASYAHMYVIYDGENLIGTGSISSFWGSKTESILLTIFVLPEWHGRGIGRKIIEKLERDELFLRASRIEIPASITACGFYEKLGYHYKENKKQLDEEGHYRMEKFVCERGPSIPT